MSVCVGSESLVNVNYAGFDIPSRLGHVKGRNLHTHDPRRPGILLFSVLLSTASICNIFFCPMVFFYGHSFFKQASPLILLEFLYTFVWLNVNVDKNSIS